MSSLTEAAARELALLERMLPGVRKLKPRAALRFAASALGDYPYVAMCLAIVAVDGYKAPAPKELDSFVPALRSVGVEGFGSADPGRSLYTRTVRELHGVGLQYSYSKRHCRIVVAADSADSVARAWAILEACFTESPCCAAQIACPMLSLGLPGGPLLDLCRRLGFVDHHAAPRAGAADPA